jgi:hypothetical protein
MLHQPKEDAKHDTHACIRTHSALTMTKLGTHKTNFKSKQIWSKPHIFLGCEIEELWKQAPNLYKGKWSQHVALGTLGSAHNWVSRVSPLLLNLEVTYFPTYLPIHRTYYLANELSRWNPIFNWVEVSSTIGPSFYVLKSLCARGKGKLPPKTVSD